MVPIYFDNNATTPVDPAVLEAMLPYFTHQYANAASTHAFGNRIRRVTETAREQIAYLLNASAQDIVFTSGATESVNLALKGFFHSSRRHIVTFSTEHKAVLDTCSYLEEIGYEVKHLPVGSDGILDLGLLSKHLRDDTALVACMWVNNETGVIQPVREVARLAHAVGAAFFTDATQAVGKFPIDVTNEDIDLLAFSAHKFYGPKGVGGLYIRRGLKLNPLLHGGGHENSLRSGTLNVASIIGMSKAAEIAATRMMTDANHVGQLRNRLEDGLLAMQHTRRNGSSIHRLYNVTNIAFANLQSDTLIRALDEICVSSGSACTASIPEPSHVLRSMGLTDQEAFGSLRFSLGRFNTHNDVEQVLARMPALLARVRGSMSPA